MDAYDGSGQARWRDIVAARLPGRYWPQQRVLIAAVDARTGEPVVFDRHSGVDLADAVAASTSDGFGPFPPYRIGQNRYINGGYRRSENADLAAGYGRVLVLSPFGGRSRMPLEWGMDLAAQAGELRAGGSRVQTVFPDGGAGEVFDASALDPSTRGPWNPPTRRDSRAARHSHALKTAPRPAPQATTSWTRKIEANRDRGCGLATAWILARSRSPHPGAKPAPSGRSDPARPRQPAADRRRRKARP
jgi:predicted acylesterase/phospholipase RssA